MEQKNGNGKQQKGLITFCINWGKVLAAMISASIVIGFIIGFIAWATRMSDNSKKIPQIETKVTDMDIRLCGIENSQADIKEQINKQGDKIDKVLFEFKKK